MIYITGDTHGQLYPLLSDIKYLTPEDYLIILGDFGFLWDKPWTDSLAVLDAQDPTILFLDGNHENFDLLKTFPIVEKFDGTVGKVSNNIFHLRRGQIYTIENNTLLVMGGARSIDKQYRTEGTSWWPEEVPNEAEILAMHGNLAEVDYKVDYILTHTFPSPLYPYIDDKTCLYLGALINTVTFKHWYFAHMHEDKTFNNKYTVLYERILKLGERLHEVV